MVLAACFEEEVTYMFCSIRFFRPNLLHFQFSTVASVFFICLFLFYSFLLFSLRLFERV